MYDEDEVKDIIRDMFDCEPDQRAIFEELSDKLWQHIVNYHCSL